MAVKVHCSICDKFIQEMEKYEFDKLTGKELCGECGEKVKKVIDELVAKEKEHVAKISEVFTNMMAKYKKLQAAHDSNIAQVQDMYRVARNELSAVLKDILER